MDNKSKELVSSLSYEIVKEIAPDEIDLFPDFQEEFLKNPNAFSEKEPKKREQMLGFALPPGSEQFITIVVLPVIFHIVDKFLPKEKDENKTDLEKMNTLRDEAYKNSILMGMTEEKAGILADALVGKAALLGFK